MSFTSSANVETPGYPETAVPKHTMYGKTKFGAKSDRLPRITLCPASFYGCDPITLYEPPKSALARFSQYLCSPFQRHPKVDLGASYDSFSKPPAWMKNEERDSVYEQRVQGPKHHRRRSAVAFCLGFFLASASMIIIIGAVLAHKRLTRQDEIAAGTDNEHISSVRRQLDVYGVDAKNTSANTSVDLFNSVVNSNNSVPRQIWMQVDNAYPALATKLNGPILEIEPKALRPIFDAAVVSTLPILSIRHMYTLLTDSAGSHTTCCHGQY